MNREFLPEAVLGITVALLLAVLAVYRTKKAPSSGVAFRGGVIATLLYGIVAAQVLVTDGLTIIGLVLLLVLLAMPVAGMVLADRMGRVEGAAATAGRAAVGVGLAAAMLIAAGQTLAMLGLVDPRTTVVVIALVTGLLVALEGLRASGRISSLALWLLIVPILLCLALGILLGSFGQAVNSIIVTPGLSIAAFICLLVAFLVLGAADAALAASRAEGGWSPVRLLGVVFAVVVLLVLGMLMFFGGAVLAPTVQFFVVPANLNALPGLAGVILAILALLFAAFVASSLAGVGAAAGQVPGSAGHTRAVAVGAVCAAALALIDPGMGQVVVFVALVAAAVAAGRSERGVRAGLIAALVGIVVLVLAGALGWGWWSALAIVAVALVARLGSGEVRPEPQTRSGQESVAVSADAGDVSPPE